MESIAAHYLRDEQQLYFDQTAHHSRSEVRELVASDQQAVQHKLPGEMQPVLLAPPETQWVAQQKESKPMHKQASQDKLSVLALVSGRAGTTPSDELATSPAPAHVQAAGPSSTFARGPTDDVKVLMSPRLAV